MKKTIVIIYLLVLVAFNLISQQGDNDDCQSLNQGCSSFCLDNNGYAIFGAKID